MKRTVKRTSKKYHSLKAASKQISKQSGALRKKKRILFAINGTILKMNIIHCRKIRWVIKGLIRRKIKMMKTMPKASQASQAP